MATRGATAVIPTETLIEFTLSAPATVVIRKKLARHALVVVHRAEALE